MAPSTERNANMGNEMQSNPSPAPTAKWVIDDGTKNLILLALLIVAVSVLALTKAVSNDLVSTIFGGIVAIVGRGAYDKLRTSGAGTSNAGFAAVVGGGMLAGHLLFGAAGCGAWSDAHRDKLDDVILLTAPACVELAEAHGADDVAAACRTAETFAPVLRELLERRVMSCPVELPAPAEPDGGAP